MRILAFSDLHRNLDQARAIIASSDEADVIIGAGDFATQGSGLDAMIVALAEARRPLLLVAGNHDDLIELRGLCDPYAHVHVLHGTGIHLSDVFFFGLGFEISNKPGALPQSCIDEAAAERLLSSCPDGGVLITHAPPFGVADLQRDHTHQGSHAVRASIEKKQPAYHFCGHIHHAWGSHGKIGTCAIHNLGPTANWFSL